MSPGKSFQECVLEERFNFTYRHCFMQTKKKQTKNCNYTNKINYVMGQNVQCV